MYTAMCRKLYLNSKIDEGDASIDVRECMENMKEDWKEDTEGRPVLSETQFAKSWFQVYCLRVWIECESPYTAGAQ